MSKQSSSSKKWLNEHQHDHYVRQAKQLGLRSRAAFKILEIQEKDHLLKPNQIVVDLGSAPGGWSQVVSQYQAQHQAQKRCQSGQKVSQLFALDLLPMDALPSTTFLQGDFTSELVYQQLLQKIGENCYVDLVLSDMAPNFSGQKSVDIPKAMYLCELALEFAQKVLDTQGAFLVKVFQGEGFDAYYAQMKQVFKQVKIRKPKSSRDRSKEIYLLAQGLKNKVK